MASDDGSVLASLFGQLDDETLAAIVCLSGEQEAVQAARQDPEAPALSAACGWIADVADLTLISRRAGLGT